MQAFLLQEETLLLFSHSFRIIPLFYLRSLIVYLIVSTHTLNSPPMIVQGLHRFGSPVGLKVDFKDVMTSPLQLNKTAGRLSADSKSKRSLVNMSVDQTHNGSEVPPAMPGRSQDADDGPNQ